MTAGPVLLDSDMLSLLSRGHPRVVARARAYLEQHGRLTLSAVSVFERLRGYRSAIRQGKPYERQQRQFELLAASSQVVPVDAAVADGAATLWAGSSARGRHALGDILIAATAAVHELPLATRNRKDFEPLAKLDPRLSLVDWTR